ncbi:hypothetical protein AMJ49_04835 [Parcubacteria bacterium DG_74_2]|nr:MAG: hypothetical protein AMJ49_04835 [Parcubacteria bacterium DG_74_2]
MINKILEKISWKWIFLIVVTALYLILGYVNFELAKQAFIGSAELFQKIIPVFVLVLMFIFLSNIFFDPQKITRFLGREAGIKGWIIVIVGGILSTGPIYMWYPLLSEFKEKGMRDCFIAAFLYNRAVKIPLLPMMIYYFGLPFAAVLTFYTVLFSIINGVLVEKLLKL